MVGDATQPAIQTAVLPKLVNSFKRFEKYLLANIFGKLAIADDPESERGDGRTLGVRQEVQGLVSALAVYVCEGCGFDRAIDT